MNGRTVAILGVSLLFGALTLWMAALWMPGQSAAAATQYVAASRDLAPGMRLTADHLVLSDRADKLPADAYFSDPRLLEGRVIVKATSRGALIADSALAPPGAKGGLSAVITDGKRAMTVKVNEVGGVAGFALPGNMVDVVLNTHEAAGATGGADQRGVAVSKIILEQILVLAAAQEAGRDETKPKVVSAVTLEVTPEQAEKLDLGRSIGTLSLVLRNQIDRKAVATPGTRKPDLLGNVDDSSGSRQVARGDGVRRIAQRGEQRRELRADGAGDTSASRTAQRKSVEVIRGIARTNQDVESAQ
jgi:pilus assembly protein CpaB